MIKSKFKPIVFLFTIILFSPGWVLAQGEESLVARVEALETQVAEQAGYISTLQAQVASLLASNPAALAAIFSGVSRSGDDIFFDGVNVHIRSGSGATDGDTGSGPTVNGLGNLIIGYDEERSFGSNKFGSHNLIMGPEHNYSNYGGFVSGLRNTITGANASVYGGRGNTAGGDISIVSGGTNNMASGFLSSIVGGDNNTASGTASSVFGASFGTASGNASSISGGLANTASGFYSSVSGGLVNTASGDRSSVSGGGGNTASGGDSSVSGGQGNTASGTASSVSGGNNRTAAGTNDWVAGSLFEDF